MRGVLATSLVLACWAVVSGCYQSMSDQPRCEPLGPSRFFADGKCAREAVEGTVARGAADEPLAAFDAKSDGFPVGLTPELLARGRERFEIYCSPCHDRAGTGRGMIVRRGYRPPPSFHEERLRQAPVGHFVDVMTNGWGAMPAYAKQVAAPDRWAIAAYVRALQRSQHATPADLTADERSRLLGEPTS